MKQLQVTDESLDRAISIMDIILLGVKGDLNCEFEFVPLLMKTAPNNAELEKWDNVNGESEDYIPFSYKFKGFKTPDFGRGQGFNHIVQTLKNHLCCKYSKFNGDINITTDEGCIYLSFNFTESKLNVNVDSNLFLY